jgi:hypothetical protein
MWSEDYEGLSSREKDDFRRMANYLLSHGYVVRYEYDTAEEITRPNNDYRTVVHLYRLLKEYFACAGWRLERDDGYGVISLTNEFAHNHLRLDRFTTLFLYVCRLIYEERREQSGQFDMVLTSTREVVDKMADFGLLARGKVTKRERGTAQRTLNYYNIIQRRDSGPWDGDSLRLLIQPSILLMVSAQSINAMIAEMEDIGREMAGSVGEDEAGDVDDAGAAEPDAAEKDAAGSGLDATDEGGDAR